MGFPAPFLLFGGLMLCAVLVLPLYCVIDAATRSSQDFLRADSNKTLWIVLPLIFGILAAIVYLAAIRPKLKALSV
jgi:hypothetical protein